MSLRTIAALALVAVMAAPALAAGTTKKKVEEPAMSAADEAKQEFNRGIAMRDEAWKLEEKLAGAEGADRAKLEKRIARAYKQAADHQQAAVAKNPEFHEAYGSLGYALRKQGDYAAALEAYDKALSLEPTYAEALEYRGEAYLGLDRPEDAKKDYAVLVGRDRSRAAQLLHSMKAWVAAKRSDGSADASVASLDGWVDDEMASLGDVAFDANGKGVW